jgi:hypothetical protein
MSDNDGHQDWLVPNLEASSLPNKRVQVGKIAVVKKQNPVCRGKLLSRWGVSAIGNNYPVLRLLMGFPAAAS